MENTLVEKITSNFDIKTITVNEKKIDQKIKNEVILFLIENQIIIEDEIYFFSICREYSYNDNPTPDLLKHVYICKNNGVKFINDSILNCHQPSIYKKMDVYKYFQAPDRNIDSIIKRPQNFYYDNIRRFEKIKTYITGKIYLDFACGYGGMIDKCSDICKDIIGIEIMDSAINILKQRFKFKFYNSIDIIENNTIDIISIFQSFELLPDHIGYLQKFYNKLKTGGKLIIETSNANKALYNVYNNDGYKNFITSLRKVIYSEDAIKFLLMSIGFNNITVEYVQRYNISNHFGWLSHNKPGNDVLLMDNDELNKIYKETLINKKYSDTLFIICEK